MRSSRIREALKIGDVETANGCLGHPYRLTGIVEHGERRGRLLGFPTANLQVEESRLRPGNGVYVCRAHLGTAAYHTITNVGTRPTFEHHPPNVEAHLLDFSGRIYGRTMQLDFLKYFRPELKFGSVDELVHQIRLDEATARACPDYRYEPKSVPKPPLGAQVVYRRLSQRRLKRLAAAVSAIASACISKSARTRSSSQTV